MSDPSTTTTTGDLPADDFTLPPYLEPLPESDPRYDALNSSAYEYAYGPNPGDGNLKEFQIIVFIEPHTAYRVWGGPSNECGYWWILAPPNNCLEVCPTTITNTTQFEEMFAVCPEWNTMTNITNVNIPANTTAVVGIGQSVNCNTTQGIAYSIIPSDDILQLNTDGCTDSPKWI